jgi:hypothetical protein
MNRDCVILVRKIHDAPIYFSRQGDSWFAGYFFSLFISVQPSVQKRDELIFQIRNRQFSNSLHFELFTGLPQAIAPIVCVDIYEWSVKVAPVDG